MKRAFDIFVSLLLLPVLAVLLLTAGIGHRLERSPGPILFRQARYGARGRQFMILKLRTMRIAEPGERFRAAV